MSAITFVQMPFAGIERPSLALGLLTAALRAAGLPARTAYANIEFAAIIDLPAYALVQNATPSALLGEWVFAESAFGPAVAQLAPLGDVSGQLHVARRRLAHFVGHRGHRDLDDLLYDLRRRAGAFVEDLAHRLVEQRPRVVACTSMFDQHVASLALLQRVKALAPEVLTVIGGANCAGPMGSATHTAFPTVDFTVTGEFDQFAEGFFRSLLEAGGDAARVAPLPPNVLGPVHRQADAPAPTAPAAILAEMDAAAIPDYDDFFEQLYASPVGDYVMPALPVETSRGCWWGAKQHCTFCGLNAEGMSFRKKSPERALREIRGLCARHGLWRLAAADNIIDMSYFQTVLPELARDERRYSMFYETKANLKREQVRALAEAGCDFIQPGIESLHDETLKLMRKGASACGNVSLLKLCVEFGILPSWSILCGFPGSDPRWVSEIAEQLPALFHLPPPLATVPIRFDRFSPYHQRPAEYGLTLEPLPAYGKVYPLPPELLAELAYFFRDARGEAPQVLEHARAAAAVNARWSEEFWSAERAVLQIEEDDGEGLSLRDTRGCAAQERQRLVGLAARLLRLLATPVGLGGLGARLAASGTPLPDAVWSAALEELVEKRLVWRSASQVVALPVPTPCRPMPDRAAAPIGRIDLRRYFLEQTRFAGAVGMDAA